MPSNLEEHAIRELRRIGEDESVIDGYVKMIRVFDKMGHSGFSGMYFISVLNELLQFRNLAPLTDDPDEWNHISEEMSGAPGGIWQSRRNAEAFSIDGGKSYYLLYEGANHKNRRPIHWSEKSGG